MADVEAGVEAALYRVLDHNRYRMAALAGVSEGGAPLPDDLLRNIARELHVAIAAALAPVVDMRPRFRGTVTDAGGGVVDVTVDRDLAVYPPLGTRVDVVVAP